MHLFRNDDKEKFQIQIIMSDSSRVHTVESYRKDEEDKARTRYWYLLKRLKARKARVQIGRDFSIIEE